MEKSIANTGLLSAHSSLLGSLQHVQRAHFDLHVAVLQGRSVLLSAPLFFANEAGQAVVVGIDCTVVMFDRANRGATYCSWYVTR